MQITADQLYPTSIINQHECFLWEFSKIPSTNLTGLSQLLILTQSLEVLHCSLMALKWRVGLGGLVEQHLQSCESVNRFEKK